MLNIQKIYQTDHLFGIYCPKNEKISYIGFLFRKSDTTNFFLVNLWNIFLNSYLCIRPIKIYLRIIAIINHFQTVSCCDHPVLVKDRTSTVVFLILLEGNLQLLDEIEVKVFLKFRLWRGALGNEPRIIMLRDRQCIRSLTSRLQAYRQNPSIRIAKTSRFICLWTESGTATHTYPNNSWFHMVLSP